MEHLSSTFQLASLGGVGVLVAQPDGAHLALYGVIFTGMCSIITAAIGRRTDREREERKDARDKQEREWQAKQIQAAFAAASAERAGNAAQIAAKVDDAALASAEALRDSV